MQEQNEPGVVVSPGTTPVSAPQPTSNVPAPTLQSVASPASVPTFAPEQSMPTAQVQTPQPAVVETENVQPQDNANQEGLFMAWQTQEFDEHAKQGSWYLGAGLVAIALTVAVFFLTEKDILVSVAVFLAVLGFAYLGSHKPREQQYALAQEGIYIGNKLRHYEEFKNFSQVDDVSGPTLVLIPHRRFSSPLVLRLTRDNVDAAVATLSDFLPLDQRKPDAIDQLMRRIRL